MVDSFGQKIQHFLVNMVNVYVSPDDSPEHKATKHNEHEVTLNENVVIMQ